MTAAVFRAALEEGDAAGLARLWRASYPELPQPRTSAEAEVMLHRARSEAESVTLAKRLYSHAWLVERGLPSGLPRDLLPMPASDRPLVVSAVGISVRARDPARAELARAVEAAMSAAAAECYAEGQTAPEVVSQRIWEARERTLRGFGERTGPRTIQ